MDRSEAIKRIRAALKKKTGKTWSVTGGRGTAWCWLNVSAPPKRRVWHETIGDPMEPGFLDKPWHERFIEVPATDDKRAYAYTSLAECRELAVAFGIPDRTYGLPDRIYGVHHQGHSIRPEDWEYWIEQAEK